MLSERHKKRVFRSSEKKMGLVRPLAGALLVSAWLLTHTLFLVATDSYSPTEKNDINEAQQLMPIRLTSVFQLSWFHKLIRQLFKSDQCAMLRGVCEVNCKIYLSWIVSALTLAEWATVTLIVLRTVWDKLVRPFVRIIGVVMLIVAAYGCARSCAFMLAPHLPQETAIAVVGILVAVDSVLLRVWTSLGSVISLVLWALDGVLSSLVWPSLEEIKDDATSPHHQTLLTEVLQKVQEVAKHFPEAAKTEF